MKKQQTLYKHFFKRPGGNNLPVFLVFGFLFTVVVSFLAAGNGNLQIDKNEFMPGEEIAVHFTAGTGFAESAWIGIIPSNVPHGSEAKNDEHDLTYQYLQGKASGTLIFKAPTTEGNYDFRMNDTDNNGKEVASVSFKVGWATTGTIQMDRFEYFQGEEIIIRFTAGPGFAANAWIGIVPSDVPHGSEAKNDEYDLTYQYLNGRKEGVLIFNAPYKYGSFDFRMNNTDDNGKEIASITFHVKEQ